jgi:hypothetical protein
LSGAITKPASINLQKLVLSPTGLIKPWFHTEGNLLLCSSYLPLGVPNWAAHTAPSGAGVPWKEGFSQHEDPYSYKSRKRKKDREADRIGNVERELAYMKRMMNEFR